MHAASPSSDTSSSSSSSSSTSSSSARPSQDHHATAASALPGQGHVRQGQRKRQSSPQSVGTLAAQASAAADDTATTSLLQRQGQGQQGLRTEANRGRQHAAAKHSASHSAAPQPAASTSTIEGRETADGHRDCGGSHASHGRQLTRRDHLPSRPLHRHDAQA